MQKRNPSPIINSVQDIFKDIKRVPRNIANFNRWFTGLNDKEKTIAVIGTMVVVYGGIFGGIKYNEYAIAKEIKQCDRYLDKFYPQSYGNEEFNKEIGENERKECVWRIKMPQLN